MSDCRRSDSGCGPSADDVQTKRQQGSEEKSREELIDDLTDCLALLESDADLEELDRCLEAIERTGPLIPDFDVERSLEDFHRKYDAPPPEAATTPPDPKEPAAGLPASKKSKGSPRFFRSMARAAIVAAVLLSLMIAGQAGLFDYVFAQWTGAQFSFVHSNASTSEDDFSPPGEMQYASLQEALDAYGITVPLAPKELPEGAVLDDLSLPKDEESPAFRASYTTQDGSFYISLRKTEERPFSEVEKNLEDINPYIIYGVEHHFMVDVGAETAVWLNDDWEGYISGEISRAELITMIDSIYK